VTFLVIIFLGGIGTLTGAILGAAVVIIVPEKISGSPDLHLVLYGAVLVIVMIAAPRGMLGLISAAGRTKYLLPRLSRFKAMLAARGPSRQAHVRRTVDGVACASEPQPSLLYRQEALSRSADPVSVLEARGVSKSYDGVRALHDASLTARRGELLGLIGPNGSGKTTFLNCLGGQVRIDAGEIRLDGRRIDQDPAGARARSGVFRTFQQGALCTSLTCLENVMLGGHRLGRVGFGRALVSVRARHREETTFVREAAALLEYLEIPHEFWDRLPDELPYGLRRLVEIGVMLMGAPEFLLLDEPAAGLVDEEITRLDDALRELLRRDMGIVLVEHHLQLVMNLAENVVVLDGGDVIAAGSPTEVVASPDVKSAYLGEGWATGAAREVRR
jgi:branched-chain amino acid transport system permease protein